MLGITKREAFYMRDNGYSEFILKSHSRKPKYYLIEETEDVYKWNKSLRQKELIRLSAMNALKEYQKSKIIKSSNAK